MESLLKNLRKHVECSICLDTFTKPKTIACLHTFCCECLKRHALASQKEGKFRCPECQAQIDIPESNRFDQLPTSFHHNSLLGLLAVQQSGDGSEITCGVCKKKSVEISYCFDCEKLLCCDCINAHEVFRNAAFEGHKVTPVKQFTAEDYEALLKRKAFCSQKYHERKVTEFYCRVCEACVCQVCLVTDHKNHDIEPLEKAADSARAKILSGAEQMKGKNMDCIDVIRGIEETAADLETNFATAKRQVSAVAEQMIATIHECEHQTISTLEKTRVSRMEKLETAKNQAQLLAKQINQAAEFASDLVQRSSSSDIIQSYKSLQERFEELRKIQFAEIQVSSFVQFFSTCKPQSLNLGFIKNGEADPKRSTVEGLSQNFQAGVEAKIFICPKTHEGEINNLHVDQVEVLIEPVDQVASLMINEEFSGNQLQVKFVPKFPGTYNITAKINGEKLAKSPFKIQVKEQQLELLGELDLQNENLKNPTGIAVNSKGLIAVASCDKHCIMIFDKEGKYVRQFGHYGKNPGKLSHPADVTFMNDDEILVAESGNHRIQQFNVNTGKYVNIFGRKGTGVAEFEYPQSIFMDDRGNFVVAEFDNNRVQVLTKDGASVSKFGDSGPGKLDGPQGCVFHKNMFIVSDYHSKCLKVFDSSGKFLRKIGEEGEADGQFEDPWGLCIDGHGNILVCDYERGVVQQFSIEGRFTGKSVVKLQSPHGIAVMADGRFLVSDSFENKVFILK